jgi:hypothetical protein
VEVIENRRFAELHGKQFLFAYARSEGDHLSAGRVFEVQGVSAEPRAAQSYFSTLGFRVEVNDLAVLAEAVSKVFVESDYVSNLIGRLGNFDIRRMLRIAERIFLSPELKIDDIIKSRFGGEAVTSNQYRTHRALIRGEYDRFTESENEYISNLFQTNPQRPGPPLLGYYLLWLLRQKLYSVRPDEDDVEKRHWLAMDLCQLLEGLWCC